jgi:hypothetical protein
LPPPQAEPSDDGFHGEVVAAVAVQVGGDFRQGSATSKVR